MINDDRFILGCLDNWEFGVDNTGDLMNIRNLDKLKVSKKISSILFKIEMEVKETKTYQILKTFEN